MSNATMSAAPTAVQSGLDDLKNRCLTFYIDDVFYGIELSHVIEIISVSPITRIPGVPHYIKGIINLRGKVAPVIDVRLKFNQEERAYDDKTCIIVVTIHDMLVGLIVDSVSEVINIDPENSTPPPDFGSTTADKYLTSIARINGRVVMKIDCEKFFQADLSAF